MAERKHPHLTLRQLTHRLWNHPRRLGFLLANTAIIAVIVAWGISTAELRGSNLAAVPTQMIGIVGIAVLVAVLVGVWVAWAIFLVWRHRPHRT